MVDVGDDAEVTDVVLLHAFRLQGTGDRAQGGSRRPGKARVCLAKVGEQARVQFGY